MKRVLVRYKEIFGGEILHDSYERYIEDDNEKGNIMRALYQDHHVTYVEIIDLTEEGEDNDTTN